MKTYTQKLLDPRWQKKRLEIMERDTFKCRDCGGKDETLHVHHSHYRKGADPWDYEDRHLVTLCKQCHQLAELRRELILKLTAHPPFQKSVLALAQILTGGHPSCPWHGWVVESAVKIAQLEEEAFGSENESEMNDAIHGMESEAAEITKTLHRILFRMEDSKESIKEGHNNAE